MIAGCSIWAVLLICIGVFIASFVDAIGGGGGLISTPVYLLAGLPMYQALGTNKLSSSIGTAASTFRYIIHGFADWGLAIPSVALAVFGGFIGTKIQLLVDEKVLKILLLFVLPAVAVVMLRRKEFPELRREQDPWVRRSIVWTASLILGAYDGFYGPGTGTFLLLVFCHLAKMDLRTASGNVKLVNFASNIGSLITAFSAGTVIVPIGLIAAVFSVAGHYIGAGMTIKNGAKVVRPVIFVVLALLAVKVITELLGIG